MIFYLNKGLILEQIIAQAMKEYFSVSGANEFYKNVTLNITNKHPFAKLTLDAVNGAKSDVSLFPAIVVATEDDGKPGELEQLADSNGVKLTIEDVTSPDEGGKSPLEARGYMMMTPGKIAAIRGSIKRNGHAYGVSWFIRRRDKIAIEIWSENIQLKNELYEHIRLFVCGYMKEALQKQYEENGLAIFDNTVKGQRSNNFNVDFGVDLAGAIITFDADYIIEQTVIDTELVGEKIDVMEVINHVKNQIGTSRSIVFDYSAGNDGDTGGLSGNGKQTSSGVY
jgi:hypothetical protein